MSLGIGWTYLGGEALDEDSDEQVEEDVVTEGHQCDEVEGCPVRCFLHTVEENDVPVFLGQDLGKSGKGHERAMRRLKVVSTHFYPSDAKFDSSSLREFFVLKIERAVLEANRT